MLELELLGPDGDGSHIVLTDADGARYRIAIDDALRAAVRRDRPVVELDNDAQTLTPREIQSLIRAGADLADVAGKAQLSPANLQAFAAPVLAEREWIASRAQECHIGSQADSPALGELVLNRLATRGVKPSSLQWDAIRQAALPWEIILTFVQAAVEKEARWSFDLPTSGLVARDDEARWLSETVSDSAPEEPHSLLGAIAHTSVPVETAKYFGDTQIANGDAVPSGTQPPPDDIWQAHALLDQLQAARGQRPAGKEDGFDDFWEVTSLNQEHSNETPADTEPDETAVGKVVSLAERNQVKSTEASESPLAQEELPGLTKAEETQTSGTPARKSKRRSVPSWDEIVFGARPE